ncbi:hypothetical protein B0I35DRAFT_424726 [Stachybotrys elegans]|uniref:ATPase synthesis protein 25 n=1 Tax=Stachybotrys elegans TaxID=80388 RepID=A0A8K0WUF1_9HYPO|nr:hypothetical protein B0I35DRAFT_424726 [Stachybotrys elegans]
MIARPAMAALSCRSCQNMMIRAVSSAATPSLRGLSQPRFLRSSTTRVATSRFLSTEQKPPVADEQIAQPDNSEAKDVAGKDTEATPWFLQVEAPRHASSHFTPKLPEVPEDAPELVKPMIKYIHEDMGLDDLALLDLRSLDPPAALGPNLIMMFGTARSERHLHICSGRFVRWLGRNYKVYARADGLIGPGELKTKLARLKRKAKLMGNNTAIVPGGDHGISTGWVCVNFSTNDSGLPSEVANVDDDGRFSGFGTPQTGTTIVIQVLTEARRNELDLESLWRGILRRNLENGMKIKGERNINRAEIEKLVKARVQMPNNPSAAQWDALQQASQRRFFSTSARRLAFRPQGSGVQRTNDVAPEGRNNTNSENSSFNLDVVEKHLEEINVEGVSFSEEVLEGLVSSILHVEGDGHSVAERMNLLDKLLLTAEERGMPIMTTNLLVTIIESLATSRAYGPELQRAQENVELLLRDMDVALESTHVLRLMKAYAARHDWDRFWDIFRHPARFQQMPSPEQYRLAYSTMAATGDSKLCAEALRWVYPEMVRGSSPILPVGPLYTALKACILVADPAAEEMARSPPPPDAGIIEQRQHATREFKNVLREVEELRSHAVSEGAALHREQLLNSVGV